MKRILTVLALLAVCGAAFSVTGAVYVRYKADNTIVATEWNGATWSLDDLRVGRRGSGFDINTDTFGVSYKIRSAQTLGAGNGVSDTIGSSVSVTSPGYIQLTSLKLGSVSADIGGAWWTAGQSKSSVHTNTKASLGTNAGTVGATNDQVSQNYGYNYFAFNLDFNVPVTEKISFQAYPWDKIQFDFGTGSATKQSAVGTNYITNSGDSTHIGLILPLHLDIGMDPISIGLFPKLAYTSDVNNFNQIGTTNNTTASDLHIGALVRLGYKIDNVWSLYAHVGIDNDSSSSVTTVGTNGGASTNSVVNNQLQAPLFIGVGFQPAGWVNLNVGLGYAAVLGSAKTTINGSTTNVDTTGGVLQETYGFFDEHGYALPFFKFAGSTKFASDWEFGMSTIVSMNGGAMGSDNSAASTTSSTGSVNQTSMLTFANNFNWDNQQCYVKYTKDAFSFQGMLGNNTVNNKTYSAGIATTTTVDQTIALAGIFCYADISINF